MRISKVLKDAVVRAILGHSSIPKGLFDLSEYGRHYGPIKFNFHREDGKIVAVSEGFQFGSIVTEAANDKELDAKIKDAILTAFEIPSVYRKQANVVRVGSEKEYALA